MSYWEKRCDIEYYAIVKDLINNLSKIKSLLDIGCNDTPVALWGNALERFTVDIRSRPQLPGVSQIIGEWPNCSQSVPICDVVTCLQTLEHVIDPVGFSKELLNHARISLIVSVPWKWKEGVEKYHTQDPVDMVKMNRWFNLKPSSVNISGEPKRAVFQYNINQ